MSKELLYEQRTALYEKNTICKKIALLEKKCLVRKELLCKI